MRAVSVPRLPKGWSSGSLPLDDNFLGFGSSNPTGGAARPFPGFGCSGGAALGPLTASGPTTDELAFGPTLQNPGVDSSDALGMGSGDTV